MWPTLIGAGASLLGGLLTQEGQENTNVANAEQAAKQMDFQERMSNTSYQRATKDMMAAGLNPMLAYSQGGAGTPGGAMATMQNALGAGVTSGQAAARTVGDIEHVRSQAANLDADTENKSAQGELYRAQAARERTQSLVDMELAPKYRQDTQTGVHSANQMEQMVNRLKEQNRENLGTWEAREAFERYALGRVHRQGHEKYAQEHEFRTPEIEEILARAKQYGVETALKGFSIPEARNAAAVAEYVGAAGSAAQRAGKFVGSAAQAFRQFRGFRR